MTIGEKDVEALVAMLSKERLAALAAKTGTEFEAIKLHQETLRVGAMLMTVIATIEIALRNTVCTNLTQHFGVQNWLRQPPAPFQWRKPELTKVGAAHDQACKSEYSKLSQADKHALDKIAYPNGRPTNKSHLQRAKDRRKQISVSDGKVIAELTFYFWKRLYGPEYEQLLWRTSLKKTFPNKKISRAEIAVNLEHIYQARNRLAHHEPVLRGRFYDTIQAIEMISTNLKTTRPSVNSPLFKLLAIDLEKVKADTETLHAKLDGFKTSPQPKHFFRQLW